jgi:hypothetical protein
MPDAIHFVDYNGHGLGYEEVTIDGSTLRISSFWSYVPRFEFKLGGRPAAVEVQVWPWLTVQSFALLVGEDVVYAEGVNNTRVKLTGLSTDWCELA